MSDLNVFGFHGMWSSTQQETYGAGKHSMKTITVVAATTRKINEHAIAIDLTAKALPMHAERLLISPMPPDSYHYDGEWRELTPAWPDDDSGFRAYNEFMVLSLPGHIKTDFAVTVHADGYATYPELWTDMFLGYDYIGAPWVEGNVAKGQNRVGNGGFSLRSKKWLSVAATLGGQLPASFNEDSLCCVELVDKFVAAGCRIAPVSIALRWSHEHDLPNSPLWRRGLSFGFHNFHPPNEFVACPGVDGKCKLVAGHAGLHYDGRPHVSLDSARDILGRVTTAKILPPLGRSKHWRLVVVSVAEPGVATVILSDSLAELTRFTSAVLQK